MLGCRVLDALSLISLVIGALGFIGLIKPLEQQVDLYLIRIRRTLNIEQKNLLTRMGMFLSFGAISALILFLVFYAFPFALLKLITLVATKFTPAYLISNPIIGFFLLGAGILYALILEFKLKKNPSFLRFYTEKHWLISSIQACCCLVILAFISPFAFYSLFGHVISHDVIFMLLFLPLIPIASIGLYLPLATFPTLSSLLWLFVAIAYYFLHLLNKLPQRVIGSLGFLFGLATYIVSESNLCS